jgi:WD40 repeat protein
MRSASTTFSAVLLAFVVPGWAGEARQPAAGKSAAKEALPPGAVLRFGTEDLRDPSAGKLLFLPDGKRLVSAGHSLRVWDLASRKLLADYPCPGGYATHLSCSPKGDRLYVFCERLLVLNTADGKELLSVPRPKIGWSACAVSPDEKYAAGGTTAGDLLLWELPGGKPVPFHGRHEPRAGNNQPNFAPVSNITFHPHRRLMATSGLADATVRVWDLQTGKETLRLSQGVGTTCMFTPDGKLLMTNDSIQRDGVWCSTELLFWDIDTGKVVKRFPGYLGYDAAWSHDGKRLVSGHGCCAVTIFDVETGKQSLKSPQFGTSVGAVAFSTDGALIAVSAHGLDVWDAKTGKSILDADGHTGLVRELRLSPDGRTLASASTDSTIRLWDVRSGKQLLKLAGAEGEVHRVSFSPKEKILVSAEHAGLRIWDLTTGRQVKKLPSEDTVQWVEHTPDGRSLVIGCADLSVRVLDGDSGKVLRQIGGYEESRSYGQHCWALSPDGKLCTRPTRDGGMVLAQVATGDTLRVFDDPDGRIITATFSPDSRFLAHTGKEVSVYDLTTMKRVATLPVTWHWDMQFGPNGKTLYLGGSPHDIASGKKLSELPGSLERSIISPDATRAYMVAPRGCSMLAWDLSLRKGAKH